MVEVDGAAGRYAVKVLPIKSERVNSKRPRWASAIQREIDRPSPAPPSFSDRDRDLSARKKRSKMRGCRSAGIPPPVSVMLKTYSAPARRQATVTRPPSEVYLIALSSKLRIIRRSRDSSA